MQMSQGHFDQAQQNLESALAAAPDNQKAQVRVLLGTVYMMQQQYEKAVAQFEASLADPAADKLSKATARMNLVTLYDVLGEPTKARAQAQMILDAQTNGGTMTAVLLVTIGNSFLAEASYAQAQQKYEQALIVPELSPGFVPGVKNKLGIALLGLGDYGVAIEIFQEVLGAGETAPAPQPNKPTWLDLSKARANQGLALAYIGQALEREKEASRLNSKLQTNELQDKTRESVAALQGLRDKFLKQFSPHAPAPATAPPTEATAKPQAP